MSDERAMPGSPGWVELSAHHLPRYMWAAKHAPGKRVLDAGCGAGYGAQLLALEGAAQVVGVDLDKQAIIEAEKTFPHPQLQYVCDDCETLSKV